MLTQSELYQLMQEPLPSTGYQKRLGYRTTTNEVAALYKLINATIFNNELVMPELIIKGRCRRYWGMCYGAVDKVPYRNTFCKIKLMDKYFCRQWLVMILAHEMCHQYQWDILGKLRVEEGKESIMTHGPSFFIFKEKLESHGVPLKRTGISQRKWFKHQNLFVR